MTRSFGPGPEEALTRPRLTVRLDNVAANYRRIVEQLGSGGARAAGVVKADGYGLGAADVASTLAAQGCSVFFVARVDEGVALRSVLGPAATAEIVVFDGAVAGSEDAYGEADLIPVLNSLDQIERWRRRAAALGRRLPAAVHVDTGMLRLGLDRGEQALLAERAEELLDGIELKWLISHLASADVAGSQQSEQQLAAFEQIRHFLGSPPSSLANSAGVYLGPRYHYDLVRPGIALYGGSPVAAAGLENPMATGIELHAPILGVRDAEPGDTVGYGATHKVDRPRRIATIALGYADGYLRSASGRGSVFVGDQRAPIVGRVSMDLITVDVTGIEPRRLVPGTPVEVIGANIPIDEAAEAAGTIGYELLVRLAPRLDRVVISPGQTCR